MTTFKKTYIYIKICNHCGLRYFGKSCNYRDINNYKGSGLYWLRHIKLYNSKIETKILKEFTDKQKCNEFCLNFSYENDIVNNDKWANLIPELGYGSGGSKSWLGKKHSEETKKKISKNNARYWKGKKLSKKTIEIIRKKALERGSFTEEHKRNISLNNVKYWKGKKLPEYIKKKMSISCKKRFKRYCGFCDKYMDNGNYIQHNHNNGFCLFK